jgi:protease IV
VLVASIRLLLVPPGTLWLAIIGVWLTGFQDTAPHQMQPRPAAQKRGNLMLKRILRWALRSAVIVIVLIIVAHIADWIAHRVASRSVLVVTLKGPVIERGGVGFRGLLAERQTPLNVVRRTIDDAADDPRIVGLAIEIFDPDMEFAQAQELAHLIANFAAHHKWTTAYLETAGDFASGNLPYLVAAQADEVSLMPQGEIDLMGVGMRELFARGLLDKVGIKPNFAAIGKYKSAANIFTQKEFTPAQHEEDDALVGDLFNQIVDGVSRERHLEPAQVRSIIDHAPLSAAAGLKAHLVDRLEYRDQFTDRIKNYDGHHHPFFDYAGYQQVSLFPHFGHRDRIAVIYADGAIERGEGGFDPLLSPGGNGLGSDEMVQAFREARDDDSVRAVVLRVNSPGGSVIGSELIRRSAELLSKRKPLVVSMSGYAASGGYWIATPAAKIFAEPATVTGSIGVLGGKFNVAPMMSSIGVNTGDVSRGANATMFDSFSDFSPVQQQQFQNEILGDTYRYFVDLVARRRGLSPARVDQIAQGRVWSGEQAVKLKLVDGLGGLEAAVNAAREIAKVPPGARLEILELPTPPSLLTQLMQGKLSMSGGAPGMRLSPRLRAALWLLDAAVEGRDGWLRAALCAKEPVT